MHRYRAQFFFLASFVFVLIPHFVYGQVITPGAGWSIVPAECNCPNAAAGWGCLIGVLNRLVQFAIYLGVIISVLMAAYAGFLWVLNPINPENRATGRKMLINAAVGLLLTLAAWIIVNTLLTVLGAGSIASTTQGLAGGPNCIVPQASTGTGPGNVSTNPGTGCPTGQTCSSSGKCTDKNPDPSAINLCGDTACNTDYTCDASDPSKPVCKPPQSCVPTNTSSDYIAYFSFDSGVGLQTAAVSPTLATFLNCAATNLQQKGFAAKTMGRISALTDTLVVANTSAITSCADNGGASCKHTIHSCHYGGRTCQGQSYAVDFGDGDPQQPDHLSALLSAANACGAKFTTSNENGRQDHLHASVGSCGCDGH